MLEIRGCAAGWPKLLIVGAPEELEFLPTATQKPDMSLIYPVDPRQLPKELDGVEWPPKG